MSSPQGISLHSQLLQAEKPSVTTFSIFILYKFRSQQIKTMHTINQNINGIYASRERDNRGLVPLFCIFDCSSCLESHLSSISARTHCAPIRVKCQLLLLAHLRQALSESVKRSVSNNKTAVRPCILLFPAKTRKGTTATPC